MRIGPKYRAVTIAVCAVAAAKFALHFYFNNQYDYFRDEFNYIACGDHPDWGFVDHPPPLIPLVAKISGMLFGDSLRVIRLVPAIASSLIVILGAMIARRCGRFAQNYGQAGAIDFFGRRFPLPPALSGHQSYFLWGPRGYSGNCLIVTGDRESRLQELYKSVERIGESNSPYALENRITSSMARFAS